MAQQALRSAAAGRPKRHRWMPGVRRFRQWTRRVADRVAAQDRRVSARQPRASTVCTASVAELEGVVGAEQHVVDADVLDEAAQQKVGEHGGVVVEAVGERRSAARWWCARHPCGPNPCRAGRAARGGSRRRARGTGSAGVAPARRRRQPGDRQRGLHRVADELGQPEVALPVGVGHAAGVQEHERPRSASSAHSSSLTGSSRSRPAAPAADRDARQPEVVEAAPGLVGGAAPTERHRARGRAAGRGRPPRRRRARRWPRATMSVANAASSAVEQNRKGGSDTAWRSTPDLVHLRQPHVDVVLRPGQRQRRERPDPADPRVEADDPVGHAREVGQAAVGEPLAGAAAAWRASARRRCPGARYPPRWDPPNR